MKTVVISGGSSGIGAATAQRFLQENYLVFNLDIQRPLFQHPHLHFIYCDLTSIQAIAHAMEKISEKVSTIEALVCSAGVHFSANILDSSEADFDRIVDINLKSCFFLTQAILPFMIKKNQGAIVYVGSDQTLVAKKNSAIYGLTKAALGNLAKSTALDFAQYQIRANLVAAGTIETPLYHHAIRNYCERTGVAIEAIHQAEGLEQPLGRVGQPEEVANFIYFLCSDQAKFITGTVLPIDGGYTAK
ncbi:MAG: family oxidoreductase [Gammaproteobacteria bacterium]|jgi:NAD(P)-dependent dehydrogenase (short-subunit alcohol dehydrogenase family)|nr:family oxidoreductase [Gammaproteobacteria bacterium]